MRKRSQWILVGVGMLAVAAPSSAQLRYRSDTRIPVSKEPMPMPEPSVVSYISVKGSDTTIRHRAPMPIPAFRLVDYLGMNEFEMNAFLTSRDTMQIATAQLAQQKVTDPGVRAYATSLEVDRVARLGKDFHVMEDEKIGATPRAHDYELARRAQVLQELSRIPSGPKFDAAFLQTQYFLLQNEIEVLQFNLETVANGDLRRLMRWSIEQATSERDTVRNLAQSLNVNIP